MHASGAFGHHKNVNVGLWHRQLILKYFFFKTRKFPYKYTIIVLGIILLYKKIVLMSGDPSTGIFLRANSYTCALKHVDAELSGKFWGKSCNDTWSTIHKLDIYCTQEVDIYFGLFIRYLLNFSALEYFF